MWHEDNPMALFHKCLQRKRILPMLARFVYRVLALYDSHIMYIADEVAV
jgi:hypothetical protein